VAEDPFTACAEQLATTPRLVRQLLHDHAPTEDGWCQAHDGHAERHPCSIRRLAELASTYIKPPNPANGRPVPSGQRTAYAR
jgi:hypothetical protein